MLFLTVTWHNLLDRSRKVVIFEQTKYPLQATASSIIFCMVFWGFWCFGFGEENFLTMN
jgi:hypothetical protein